MIHSSLVSGRKRRRKLFAAIALTVFAASLVSPASAQKAQFLRIQTSPDGGGRTEAFGMSPDGVAVVGRQTLVGSDAFVWIDNDVTRLTTGAVNRVGVDASMGGEYVIISSGVADDQRGRVWSAATGPIDLGTLGGLITTPSAISADGSVIVGSSELSNGDFRPFRYENGSMTMLDATASSALGLSPDGSVTVGSVVFQSGNDLITEAAMWTGTSRQVLGRPAGFVGARALDASEGGAVIVGRNTQNGLPPNMRGFRWTAETGFVVFSNFEPTSISPDGTVVAGSIVDPSLAVEAAIWTEEDGVRPVRAILEDQGVNISGWQLGRPVGVTRQGDAITVAGGGFNPLFGGEAWKAIFPVGTFQFTTPTRGQLVDPAGSLGIGWTAEGTTTLDLYYTTDFQPDVVSGNNVLVAAGLSGAGGAHTWDLPDTLLSPDVRLLMVDAADSTRYNYSDPFRVRYPDALHRILVVNSERVYEAFHPELNGWQFANDTGPIWPESYWINADFDYTGGLGGADPYSRVPYAPEFSSAPIFADPSVFPDWPSFVRAFGTDDAYTLLVPDIDAVYRPSALSLWGSGIGQFQGACSGMSVAALMAFADRARFGARYPKIGAPDYLHDLLASNAAREAIVELHVHWEGFTQRQWYAANFGNDPRTTLEKLRHNFRSDLRDTDSYLYLINLDPASALIASGAHAVVPYDLVEDPATEGLYYVTVYDPNLPGEEPYLLIDSTANTWSYPWAPVEEGETDWRGSAGMVLMDPVDQYYSDAVFPLSPRPLPGKSATTASHQMGQTDIAPAPGANVEIHSQTGMVFGFGNGGVYNTILGASIHVAPVGGTSSRKIFAVPPGEYEIKVSRGAAIMETGRVYRYARTNPTGDGTPEYLAYSPGTGFRLASRDAGSRSVSIGAMDWTEATARQFELHDLALVGADSVAVAIDGAIEGEQVEVLNYGSAKTYALEIRTATGQGAAHFLHTTVPLSAGARQVIVPVWDDLRDSGVEVYADNDGDGTVDDTLSLSNESTMTGLGEFGEGDGRARSESVEVLQLVAYPNPAGPGVDAASVVLDLPLPGRARVDVFDVLGRRVVTLVDAPLPSGRHTTEFTVRGWPAGLYFIRAVVRQHDVETTSSQVGRRLTSIATMVIAR